jgi:hypothetical protein
VTATHGEPHLKKLAVGSSSEFHLLGKKLNLAFCVQSARGSK